MRISIYWDSTVSLHMQHWSSEMNEDVVWATILQSYLSLPILECPVLTLSIARASNTSKSAPLTSTSLLSEPIWLEVLDCWNNHTRRLASISYNSRAGNEWSKLQTWWGYTHQSRIHTHTYICTLIHTCMTKCYTLYVLYVQAVRH